MIDLQQLVRPNIWALKPYSSARDEFSGSEGIFLDANENPYGTWNRYPDPYQKDLKQKLAEIKGVSPSTIFVGNGSDEVFDLAYRIFCNPAQDKALGFFPSYGMYDVSANINDVELIKIPLTDDFQIDINAVRPYFQDRNLKLIFISSPNNPTGNCFHKDDIKLILNEFNGIVIIDEAYIDFSEEDSFISMLNEYNNLIISQTFSKSWGLAAARVGLAFAHEDIIQLYNKVKPPYNVSALNQKAAIEALSHQTEFQERLDAIKKEKLRMEEALKQIPTIKKIYPSQANFLLMEVENANEMYQKLVDLQIIIRNRHSQIDHCIRISIGTPEENNALIQALNYLK